MRTRTSYLLLGVALAALPACGSARRGTPVGPPLELTTDEQRQGEVAYMRYCNGCHPGGEGGLGPALNSKPLPGWAVRYQVRHGLGAMPAFPERVIPDDELDALVAYMGALRRHD